MAIAAKSTYQLVDGILDEGLPFVASYLKKMLNRPIIIADHNGFIHYPNISKIPAQIDDMFVQLPSNPVIKEYYYQEKEGYLCYPVGYNRTFAYVIVTNLPLNMVPKTCSILIEAKLAIKCYFSNLNKTNKNKERFEKKLAEYLFYQSNEDVKDIIELSEKELDIYAPYYAVIVAVDEANDDVNWQKMCSFSWEYLNLSKLDVILLNCLDCMIAIVPARFNSDALITDPDWSRVINKIKYKEAIDTRFNISSSHAIGRTYALLDLQKSYYEARLALTMGRLMGKQSFVQQFSRMGVFSTIFTKDTESLRIYCLETLGKLIEHDKSSNGDLLATLRQLLDNGMNWKSTAESLFIHINTLYYRVKKIEEILDCDLSLMDARVNLYIAIKVWDTLKLNGFYE